MVGGSAIAVGGEAPGGGECDGQDREEGREHPETGRARGVGRDALGEAGEVGEDAAGGGTDREAEMGPLVSGAHLAKVKGYIDAGDDPQPMLADLATRTGVRYLHRPANLEDLFIKLTGRELREQADAALALDAGYAQALAA